MEREGGERLAGGGGGRAGGGGGEDYGSGISLLSGRAERRPPERELCTTSGGESSLRGDMSNAALLPRSGTVPSAPCREELAGSELGV